MDHRGGAISQLVARGEEDRYVLMRPSITRFYPTQNSKIVITNTIIYIDLNEQCSLSFEPFDNYETIVQCSQCRHCYKHVVLESWFQQSPTCPTCRGTPPTVTFLGGKARHRLVAPLRVQPVPQFIVPITDSLIYIQDPTCHISFEPIMNEEAVAQCAQCHHVFKHKVLEIWFAISETCPMCRGPHSFFLGGKACIKTT